MNGCGEYPSQGRSSQCPWKEQLNHWILCLRGFGGTERFTGFDLDAFRPGPWQNNNWLVSLHIIESRITELGPLHSLPGCSQCFLQYIFNKPVLETLPQSMAISCGSFIPSWCNRVCMTSLRCDFPWFSDPWSVLIPNHRWSLRWLPNNGSLMLPLKLACYADSRSAIDLNYCFLFVCFSASAAFWVVRYCDYFSFNLYHLGGESPIPLTKVPGSS